MSGGFRETVGMARLLLVVSPFLIFATSFAQTPVPPSAPVPRAEAAPVVLTEQGGGIYVMDNGVVRVTLDGPDAGLSSIVYKGEEMVAQQGRHSHTYFSMDGGEDYQVPANCVCKVKSKTDEMADVGCRHTYNAMGARRDPHAVDIEIHYVVRRGNPGVYVYAILSHPASYPATNIGEWRMVWQTGVKNGNYLLDRIYADDLRHWTTPTMADQAAAETMPIKEISLFKTGAWAGKMESKYTYSANYEDIGAFGFASDALKLGAWTVMGNFDYYNDGPRKQDLTVLSGTMTHHFGRNHYDGTGIHIDKGEQWSKIFGPFLLFFNSGLSADALWQDAHAQSTLEGRQWPYEWLTDVPEYPSAAARGSVTGKFRVADLMRVKQTGAYAWVGLAQPPAGLGFQSEAKNYQYWVHARFDGAFRIPAVRPGTYTLYAFVDGEAGEYVQQNVTVKAGEVNALGDVLWSVPHAGSHVAWEIGYPNRDSTEFRHGKDFFTPYLYKNFAKEFTNPLVYDVARSEPNKDWNYAQSVYVTKDGKNEPWKWSVHFSLDEVPKAGEGALVLALAGSNKTKLNVILNGKTLKHFEPELDGGNGLLRQSSYSKYSHYTIPVAMSELHKGENTLDLVQDSARDESVIFYDYLALELPD